MVMWVCLCSSCVALCSYVRQSCGDVGVFVLLLRLVQVGTSVASVGLVEGFEVPTIVGSKVQGIDDSQVKGSR